MQHHQIHHTNVKVVSNFLKFDNEGKVTGLAGDVIHIYNKNESAIQVSFLPSGGPFYKTYMPIMAF